MISEKLNTWYIIPSCQKQNNNLAASINFPLLPEHVCMHLKFSVAQFSAEGLWSGAKSTSQKRNQGKSPEHRPSETMANDNLKQIWRWYDILSKINRGTVSLISKSTNMFLCNTKPIYPWHYSLSIFKNATRNEESTLRDFDHGISERNLL